MEPVSEAKIVCPACKAELSPNVDRCDRCGSAATAAGANRESESKWRKFIDNPWVILGFMFGAAMVLGLPFLWKSRGFSILGKMFWTVAVTLYTILVFWIFWQLVLWCWGRIAPVFGTLL